MQRYAFFSHYEKFIALYYLFFKVCGVFLANNKWGNGHWL